MGALWVGMGVAAAEPERPAAERVADDCARQRAAGKPCVLSIEAEDIGGTHVASDEVNVALARFTRHSSLIHIRRDFIAEMLTTADDL